VIAGVDSIVKNVIGAKMSNDDAANQFYVVKSFSGATLAERDFVKPLTRKKPDKLILHVGTNNLKHPIPWSILCRITESKKDLLKIFVGKK
jgi:hypothetical protein